MQVVLKINVRKKAFILVVGIIIAAGALFTAVYDVIYKYNSSNTINLNAATVDYTGKTRFGVGGTKNNGAESTTLSFDAGTYVVAFSGQQGKFNGGPGCSAGACCIAFYKADGSAERPNSMTVVIGEGGGLGSYANGGGKTVVSTNFALPNGYNGEYQAMASGGGAFYAGQGADDNGRTFNVADGTFAGWEADGWAATMQKIGIKTNHIQGTPATQTHGGWLRKYISETEEAGFIMTPNYTSGNDAWSGKQGLGGGAGYFDGGACVGMQYAGGGSCTPWCYPLCSSDTERPMTYARDAWESKGNKVRVWKQDVALVCYYRIDPEVSYYPASNEALWQGNGIEIELKPGVNVEEGNERRHSVAKFVNDYDSYNEYDTGLRTGWVYSVSEDGKSWHGVGPDGLRSATQQDI